MSPRWHHRRISATLRDQPFHHLGQQLVFPRDEDQRVVVLFGLQTAGMRRDVTAIALGKLILHPLAVGSMVAKGRM